KPGLGTPLTACSSSAFSAFTCPFFLFDYGLITFVRSPALDFLALVFDDNFAGVAMRRLPKAVPRPERALTHSLRRMQPRLVHVNDQRLSIRFKCIHTSIVF